VSNALAARNSNRLRCGSLTNRLSSTVSAELAGARLRLQQLALLLVLGGDVAGDREQRPHRAVGAAQRGMLRGHQPRAGRGRRIEFELDRPIRLQRVAQGRLDARGDGRAESVAQRSGRRSIRASGRARARPRR